MLNECIKKQDIIKYAQTCYVECYSGLLPHYIPIKAVPLYVIETIKPDCTVPLCQERDANGQEKISFEEIKAIALEELDNSKNLNEWLERIVQSIYQKGKESTL